MLQGMGGGGGGGEICEFSVLLLLYQVYVVHLWLLLLRDQNLSILLAKTITLGAHAQLLHDLLILKCRFVFVSGFFAS